MISYISAATIMFFIGSVIALSAPLSFELLSFSAIFLVGAPLAFCTAIYLIRKMKVWVLFIIPAFLFMGMTVTTFRVAETIRPLYPYAEQKVTLRGTVCSLPKDTNGLLQFMFEVNEVETAQGIHALKEKIKVSTTDYAVVPGGSICMSGKLKVIGEPKNSTSFNAKRYYQRQGIYFSLFTDNISNSPTIYKLSLKDRISLFINMSMDNYINQFGSEASGFIKGIILNNKSRIPDEAAEQMIKAGTYRYIYCPYIHFSIILYLMSFWIYKKRKYFLSGVCVFLLYLFMNFTVPSAWRICLFFILSYALTRTLKIYNVRMVFFLTILTTGIISPLTITEPGFIISITCVALMRGFFRDLSRALRKIIHNRPLAQFLSIYLIISVGIYPICSFFGMNMTPWSFVLGLVMTPLITIIYYLFYIGLFIFSFSSFFATLGIDYLIKAVELISEYASELPFATINTKSCSPLFLLAFYSVLYCIYLRLRNRKNIKGEILTSLVCFVFVASFATGIFNAEITFLSVGNADCCIIELPFRKTVMIDGGGSAEYADYDIGNAEVVPYLASKGINKIDSILVSHYDKDHADGVVTVMQSLPVGEIFIPDYLPNNDLRDIIESEASAHNIKINVISKPGKIRLAKDLICHILLCENDKSSNDNSLVAKVMYGDISILFPGDISVFAEARLSDTKADILKVAHHGSVTSTGESFIKSTDPKYSVISVGADNPYGHPAASVVERCERQGSCVLRTDISGDIHFIMNKDEIKRVYSFKEWFYGG